jgi:hypothetical protein
MVDEDFHGGACKRPLHELHSPASSWASCPWRIVEVLKDLKAKISFIWNEDLVPIIKQLILHRITGVIIQIFDDVL